MSDKNLSNKELLLKMKDEVEFLGQKIKLANKSVILDQDWQLDAMTHRYALDCIIYLVGEDNFENVRKLAHEEADKRYPGDDESDDNKDYYSTLLTEFVKSIQNILPKELRSKRMGWRRS